METVTLICILLVGYTYIGYPVLVWLMACIKKPFRSEPIPPFIHLPSVTLVIPAYNEAAVIEQKIENCLVLDYPGEKLSIIVVTDGSVDEGPAIVSRYPQVLLLHYPERKGKAEAINRAMQQVRSDLVVFTDANAMLNPGSIAYLVRYFAEPSVGMVAGEKRISDAATGNATAGESWYWHYESLLKKSESVFYSVMGAAGELCCMRSSLFTPIAADTIVDDLAISLEVSLKGYRIRYEPAAFAVERSSHDAQQELERKTRIAAGGIQSLSRYGWKLLRTKPLLAFEYFTHRVFRWLLAPYLLLLALGIGICWLPTHGITGWMGWLCVAQGFFYLVALLGWLLEKAKWKAGWFYAPFYFCLLHYAMMAGLARYCFGKQTVLWQKANR